MIDYFRELGDRIEDRWRERHYDEEIFPDLAVDEVCRRPPIEHIGLDDLYAWLFGPHHGYRQPAKTQLFGEPPIQLYEASHVYIEALFWRSATTDIHEHGFSGAFYVLAGSSVHSHWSFETARQINSRIRTGRLDRRSTEILEAGDIQPIRSGDRLIHQLFHLDVPSVTIVVRTYQDSHQLPQYQYMMPGLGIGSVLPDTLRQRRTLLLDGMARGELEGLETHVPAFLDRADLETHYFALSTLTRHRSRLPKGFLDACFQRARRRHGELAELFWKVCEEQRRARVVKSRRRWIQDPDARYLLALLMLMPDRDAIFDAVRLRAADHAPAETIYRWLEPVAGPKTTGFELGGARGEIFRGLVDGDDTESILRRLAAKYQSESMRRQRDELAATIEKLAASDLFRPLFSASPRRPEPTFPGD